MLEVKNIVKLNEEQEIKLKQNYIKALEDRKFKELVGAVKIEDELLMKYTTRLQEASIEFDNCKNCKCLAECKNKVRGYTLVPAKDNNRIVFSSYYLLV